MNANFVPSKISSASAASNVPSKERERPSKTKTIHKMKTVSSCPNSSPSPAPSKASKKDKTVDNNTLLLDQLLEISDALNSENTTSRSCLLQKPSNTNNKPQNASFSSSQQQQQQRRTLSNAGGKDPSAHDPRLSTSRELNGGLRKPHLKEPKQKPSNMYQNQNTKQKQQKQPFPVVASNNPEKLQKTITRVASSSEAGDERSLDTICAPFDAVLREAKKKNPEEQEKKDGMRSAQTEGENPQNSTTVAAVTVEVEDLRRFMSLVESIVPASKMKTPEKSKTTEEPDLAVDVVNINNGLKKVEEKSESSAAEVVGDKSGKGRKANDVLTTATTSSPLTNGIVSAETVPSISSLEPSPPPATILKNQLPNQQKKSFFQQKQHSSQLALQHHKRQHPLLGYPLYYKNPHQQIPPSVPASPTPPSPGTSTQSQCQQQPVKQVPFQKIPPQKLPPPAETHPSFIDRGIEVLEGTSGFPQPSPQTHLSSSEVLKSPHEPSSFSASSSKEAGIEWEKKKNEDNKNRNHNNINHCRRDTDTAATDTDDDHPLKALVIDEEEEEDNREVNIEQDIDLRDSHTPSTATLITPKLSQPQTAPAKIQRPATIIPMESRNFVFKDPRRLAANVRNNNTGGSGGITLSPPLKRVKLSLPSSSPSTSSSSFLGLFVSGNSDISPDSSLSASPSSPSHSSTAISPSVTTATNKSPENDGERNLLSPSVQSPIDTNSVNNTNKKTPQELLNSLLKRASTPLLSLLSPAPPAFPLNSASSPTPSSTTMSSTMVSPSPCSNHSPSIASSGADPIKFVPMERHRDACAQFQAQIDDLLEQLAHRDAEYDRAKKAMQKRIEAAETAERERKTESEKNALIVTELRTKCTELEKKASAMSGLNNQEVTLKLLRLADLDVEVKDARAALEHAGEERSKLVRVHQEELQRVTDERDEFATELRQARNLGEDREKDLVAARRELRSLRVESEKLRNDADQLRVTNTELTAEKVALKNAQEAQKCRSEKLAEKLRCTREAKAVAESERDTERKLRKEGENTRVEMEQHVKRVEEEHDALKVEFDALQKRFDTETARLNSECDAARTDVKNRNKRVVELCGELEQVKKRSAEELQALQNLFDGERVERQKLDEKLRAANAELQTLRKAANEAAAHRAAEDAQRLASSSTDSGSSSSRSTPADPRTAPAVREDDPEYLRLQKELAKAQSECADLALEKTGLEAIIVHLESNAAAKHKCRCGRTPGPTPATSSTFSSGVQMSGEQGRRTFRGTPVGTEIRSGNTIPEFSSARTPATQTTSNGAPMDPVGVLMPRSTNRAVVNNSSTVISAPSGVPPPVRELQQSFSSTSSLAATGPAPSPGAHIITTVKREIQEEMEEEPSEEPQLSITVRSTKESSVAHPGPGRIHSSSTGSDSVVHLSSSQSEQQPQQQHSRPESVATSSSTLSESEQRIAAQRATFEAATAVLKQKMLLLSGAPLFNGNTPNTYPPQQKNFASSIASAATSAQHHQQTAPGRGKIAAQQQHQYQPASSGVTEVAGGQQRMNGVGRQHPSATSVEGLKRKLVNGSKTNGGILLSPQPKCPRPSAAPSSSTSMEQHYLQNPQQQNQAPHNQTSFIPPTLPTNQQLHQQQQQQQQQQQSEEQSSVSEMLDAARRRIQGLCWTLENERWYKTLSADLQRGFDAFCSHLAKQQQMMLAPGNNHHQQVVQPQPPHHRRKNQSLEHHHHFNTNVPSSPSAVNRPHSHLQHQQQKPQIQNGTQNLQNPLPTFSFQGGSTMTTTVSGRAEPIAAQQKNSPSFLKQQKHPHPQ